MVQLAYSDTFLNNIVIHYASVLLAACPVAGILYSTPKMVSPYVESHQCRGSMKHFPPALLTSPSSPYFIVDA